MDIRYYIDPETGLPHIYGHGISEDEVEEVLAYRDDDFQGRSGSRIAIGQTYGGRYLCVVYARSRQGKGMFVITAFEPGRKTLAALRRRRRKRGMRRS